MIKLYNNDCLQQLKELADNSVDSIITDPPYELGFMGKSWDNTGIANNKEMWAECLRVLKHGGHLLAFGGTRTYHRMACAIEDAGFEVRDMIEWVYGSGFPKSLNIGKAIDKLQGNERQAIGRNPNSRENCNKNNTLYESGTVGKTDILTKGTSEWEGWGTALKPAHEPICMARKPLAEKTVAENVLKWGTGGINIDESRVETKPRKTGTKPTSDEATGSKNSLQGSSKNRQAKYDELNLGRFPANLITDGSDEVRECFPETKSGGGNKATKTAETFLGTGFGGTNNSIWKCDSGNASRFFKSIPDNKKSMWFNHGEADGTGVPQGATYNDNGNASRFFKSIIYQAKASKSDRNEGLDNYLTVKYNRIVINNNKTLCKEENMVAVQLLQKVISGQGAVNFNIDEFGVNIMVQCHRDFLSTILTKTSKIIELKILNLLMLSLINECTQGVKLETENGGSLVENVENLKKWILIITKDNQELALGASRVVYQMLQQISVKENWKEATNFHNTVKPTALMQYLIKMITPKGGIVLDPFMGSGSTGKACIKDGFSFIGIEKEEEYFKIAEARILTKDKQLTG